MPKVGTPEFNWEAPCLEQELIRWESVVEYKLESKQHNR